MELSSYAWFVQHWISIPAYFSSLMLLFMIYLLRVRVESKEQGVGQQDFPHVVANCESVRLLSVVVIAVSTLLGSVDPPLSDSYIPRQY